MRRNHIPCKVFQRQRRQQKITRQQGQHQSRRAIAADPAVLQDGEDLIFSPSATKPIRSIGKTILMQASGDQHEVEKHCQGNQRRTQMEHQQPLQEDSTGTDYQSHKRKELGGTRQRIGLESDRWHRNSREKLKRHHNLITQPANLLYRIHSFTPLTPAEANVAISLYRHIADSMIGIASTAPVPSPSRMFSERIGFNPMS